MILSLQVLIYIIFAFDLYAAERLRDEKFV